VDWDGSHRPGISRPRPGRAVECVKVDATDMGRGLYQKFGFVDECPVERWVRSPAPLAPVALGSCEFDAAMDLRAFWRGPHQAARAPCRAANRCRSPGRASPWVGRCSKAALFRSVRRHLCGGRCTALRWLVCSKPADTPRIRSAPPAPRLPDYPEAGPNRQAPQRDVVRMARGAVCPPTIDLR
jgi:hypothetical protein